MIAMQNHRFQPYIGVTDKMRLERIRRDIVGRIANNERQAKIINKIIGEYPFERNLLQRQKNYLLAIQEYRKDLAELGKIIDSIDY